MCLFLCRRNFQSQKQIWSCKLIEFGCLSFFLGSFKQFHCSVGSKERWRRLFDKQIFLFELEFFLVAVDFGFFCYIFMGYCPTNSRFHKIAHTPTIFAWPFFLGLPLLGSANSLHWVRVCVCVFVRVFRLLCWVWPIFIFFSARMIVDFFSFLFLVHLLNLFQFDEYCFVYEY